VGRHQLAPRLGVFHCGYCHFSSSGTFLDHCLHCLISTAMGLENVSFFIVVLLHFLDITIKNVVLSRDDSDLIFLVICIFLQL
jgi:hypothetical protein